MLLGGIHTNSSAIEETFLEANYQCNDCNRKWEGDGGISDEEYLHMLLLKYVKNSFQEFTSSENLREFLWKADAYIHGIDEREKITGYQFKDKIYIENETLLSKFYFYKSYACLCYVLNIIKHGIYSKERAFYEINSACQSGIEDCLCAQKLASNKEYDYCIYILKKIRKHCLGADIQISDVMQSNGSNEDAIIGDEFWFGLYDNINNYPSYGNEQKYNRKELVSFWLTNDLRLSLWFLNSVQLGSICNRTMIYKSECTLDDFEESNAQFRQNFRIPIDEKIIYHRFAKWITYNYYIFVFFQEINYIS